MRVVLVVGPFPQLSETFIVNKFLGLVEEGVDVHVVTPKLDRVAVESHPDLRRPHVARRLHEHAPFRSASVAAAENALASARSLAMSQRARAAARVSWQRGGLRDVVSTAQLVGAVLSHAPDLVHFEFGTLARGACAPIRSAGIPTVVSFRGFDVNFAGLGDDRYFDDVWSNATALHFLSADLRRRALRRGCPSERPSWLIAPGIDATRFCSTRSPSRPPSDESPLRLLSVGRLHWKKGYEWGLEAVRIAAQSISISYRIVGEGPHRDAIVFGCDQLGLRDRVELVGPVQHGLLEEHLGWAVLFLHPAVSEGFCNAVLEAQASSLPVVCSDADGLSENVAHGVTGLVVPRREPRAMAEAVLALASDPARRDRMGESGRRRVQEQFTIEAHVRAFIDLYQSTLDSLAI